MRFAGHESDHAVLSPLLLRAPRHPFQFCPVRFRDRAHSNIEATASIVREPDSASACYVFTTCARVSASWLSRSLQGITAAFQFYFQFGFRPHPSREETGRCVVSGAVGGFRPCVPHSLAIVHTAFSVLFGFEGSIRADPATVEIIGESSLVRGQVVVPPDWDRNVKTPKSAKVKKEPQKKVFKDEPEIWPCSMCGDVESCGRPLAASPLALLTVFGYRFVLAACPPQSYYG